MQLRSVWQWIWAVLQVALLVGALLIMVFGVYSMVQVRIHRHG